MTPPPPPPEPASQPGKPALPAATVAADASSPAEAAQDSARLEALKKVQEFEEDVLIHIPGDSRSRSHHALDPLCYDRLLKSCLPCL